MGTTLERLAELDRIGAALDQVAQGHGTVLVIEGEAGIGKTRLIEETRARAKERRFARLHAIGDELESVIAWALVRQLVDRQVSRHSGAARAALLAGPAGKALEALDTVSPDAGDAEVARTLHALWWVAVDLATPRPLLITVDDAQWSDLPSLRFLCYLAKRVSDLPIGLVVATRPPVDQSGLLAELTVARHVERLLPKPLTRAGITGLASERLPSDAALAGPPDASVVNEVLAASGGNPFLAESLLDELKVLDRAVSDPDSAAVIRGLGSRAVSRTMLARLSSPALRLAGAVAVLGTRADLWTAGAVAELADAALADAVGELTAASIVSPAAPAAGGTGGLDFVHPVIRESVRSMIGPVAIAALHARAAEVLWADRAPAERIAAHLVQAPTASLDHEVEILRDAASSSTAAGDAAGAVRYLTRALERSPQDATLEGQLGTVLLRSDQPRRARDHLRAAAASSVGPERARLLCEAASATALVDGPLAAIAELERTLASWPGARLDPTPDSAQLALEARLGIVRSYLATERARASEHLGRFAGLPGHTPDERTLLALLAQAGRYDASSAVDVRRTAARALADGALFADSVGQTDPLVGWLFAMMALIGAEGIADARAEIAGAQDWVRRHGSPIEYAMVGNVADFLAWRCGDLRAVEADADGVMAAVELEDLTPQVMAIRVTASTFAGYAALERGDLAAAAALIAGVVPLGRDSPRVIAAIWLHEVRALVALGRNDPVGALDHAYRLRDEMAAARLETPVAHWRPSAVAALMRLGSADEARELASDHLGLARRWGAATDLGAALRLVARTAGGDSETRIDLLTEAVTVLEASPAQLELAKSLVDLGEAHRVVGRRTAGRELLIRGGDLAEACGSTVVRDRAAEALSAMGDRPRSTPAGSGQDALTASERRIAGLAVSGRTNRDIAHELFVSPKTVENHLGHIYTKLGIRGRRQLARALA